MSKTTFQQRRWAAFTAQRPEPDDPTLCYGGAGRSEDKLRYFTSTPFYQALLPETQNIPRVDFSPQLYYPLDCCIRNCARGIRDHRTYTRLSWEWKMKRPSFSIGQRLWPCARCRSMHDRQRSKSASITCPSTLLSSEFCLVREKTLINGMIMLSGRDSTWQQGNGVSATRSCECGRDHKPG